MKLRNVERMFDLHSSFKLRGSTGAEKSIYIQFIQNVIYILNLRNSTVLKPHVAGKIPGYCTSATITVSHVCSSFLVNFLRYPSDGITNIPPTYKTVIKII